jgi:hypothetical protein
MHFILGYGAVIAAKRALSYRRTDENADARIKDLAA